MSKTAIFESNWFGQMAYVVETSKLRVITTPRLGAKIVSIFDKEAAHEWLLPPANRPFQEVLYGALFTGQDMSGWDEMLPTIEACDYPVPGQFEGAMLPDHGEVWTLPWNIIDIQTDSLTMAVAGRSLPYLLKRIMRVIGVNKVRLEYEVLNTGQEDLVMLWAAHPQFKVDADTRIVLPLEVQNLFNVLKTEDWNAVGGLYSWPNARTANGEAFKLDRINASGIHKYWKFYVPPEQAIRWAALVQLSGTHWLRLGWDPNFVPFLGIWIDDGVFNPVSTIALEPATGFYDSLTRAWANQRIMRVQPEACYQWYIDVETGRGKLDAELENNKP